MKDMTIIHLYDQSTDETHEMYSILDAEDFMQKYPSTLAVSAEDVDVIQYLNNLMEVLND
jgi:hypothetical protein